MGYILRYIVVILGSWKRKWKLLYDNRVYIAGYFGVILGCCAASAFHENPGVQSLGFRV